jgi:ABC-type uncharacterized transport system fused permease/ATPase subunit
MFARLFKFDSLITPSILKFVFYTGVVLSVLGALSVIASGFKLMEYQFVLGLAYIVGGLILTLVGIVVSRVVTEMMLVIFMIRDELAWQRQNVAAPTRAPLAAE